MKVRASRTGTEGARRVSRRTFAKLLPAALAYARSAAIFAQSTGVHFSVLEYDRIRILAAANREVASPVLTLRSVSLAAPFPAAEGAELHSTPANYFQLRMESDAETASPYLQQVDLLVKCVARVAALTAAWRLTREQRFFDAALLQVKAWCLDPATSMSPTLEKTGTLDTPADDLRINGVCQTVCLAEFARATALLCTSPEMPVDVDAGLRAWFASLLAWINDSKRGQVARDSKDLQAICWAMQAAELARFTRNDAVLRECTHSFRDRLLRQMTLDGNFPPALQTKRPYAASMFTLECLGAACESLSTPFESQWNFTLPDGRGMRAAIAWAAPYLANKGKWPYVSDAHLFGEQPLRCNALLFAGRARNRLDYTDLWKQMRTDTEKAELIREHPITQPGLWAMRPPA